MPNEKIKCPYCKFQNNYEWSGNEVQDVSTKCVSCYKEGFVSVRITGFYMQEPHSEAISIPFIIWLTQEDHKKIKGE